MILKVSFYFLLIFWASVKMTISQNLHLSFYHITMEKGLSNNTTFHTLMCKRGFIWIATETGLNRFDGYNFRVYTHDPDNPRSLPSNAVREIIEDSHGNIWITTITGASKYNWETDDFTVFLNDGSPWSIIDNNPSGIGLDTRQRTWILTPSGISILDLENDTITHLTHDPNRPNSLIDNHAISFQEDNQGRYWIATRNGLSIYDENRQRFTNFRSEQNNRTSLTTNWLTYLYHDSRGRMWVGSYNGLMLWNETTRSFKSYFHENGNPRSLPNNHINSITESQTGEIWIGTSGGLARYNEETDNFTSLLRRPDDAASLSNNDINHVHFDLHNVMWVSTRFGGINVHDPGLKKFTHYRNNPLDSRSLADNNVTSFAEDQNGNIWVGVDGGGLNFLNRRTNIFTRYQADRNRSNSLPDDKVLALHTDSRGNIWIGMWGGGLSMYNPRNHSFRNFKHDPNRSNSIIGDNVFYILEDINGEIWVSEWSGGISIYSFENNSFRRHYPNVYDPNALPPSAANQIMRDSNQDIWLVHENGSISRYDRQRDHYIRYTPSEYKELQENESIFCIHEDLMGRYWLGTTYGIVLFDPIEGTFITFSTQDGLANNNVVGILEDQDGFLWLSTYGGLSRFDPDNIMFRNYETADGLQSNQFNRWAFKKLSSGELLFGGINGFNLFNPSEVHDNLIAPPIYIVDFRLFNESVPIGSSSALNQNIITSESITLQHWQNVISFEFAALNFRNPERNQYRYMLEGFNENWINLRNERRISFTNLNPGRYTLRIIASNNDGLWNEEGVSLVIRVVPPYWRTWWFISLVVLFIISLIWLFIKQRERVLRRDKELLQESIKKGEVELENKKDEIEKQKQAILEKEKQEAALKWHNAGLAEFSSLISKHKDDLDVMTNKLISELVRYIDANIGGIYIFRNEANSEEGEPYLEMVNYFAPDEIKLKNKIIYMGDGIIGSAFQDQTPALIDDLPEGYAKLTSGLGETNLKALSAVPVVFDNKAMGVFEMLSLKPLESYKIEFLTKVGELLAANLLTINANARTQKLLKNMQENNEMLASQEEEMRQNLEEMTSTKEEMERQQVVFAEEKARTEEIIKKYKEELSILKKQLSDLNNNYLSANPVVD